MENVKKMSQLLDQVQEIERAARRIQINNPTSLSIAEIEEIRDRYQSWYEECVSLLPEDLRNKFQQQYENRLGSPKIKQFLTYPIEPNAYYAEASTLTKLLLSYWKYPYKTTFYEPVMEQQSLLRQARKRLASDLSLVNEQLRRTIASICKRSFHEQSIDKLFTANGCEAKWWTQPKKHNKSDRMNRVYGWFEAILLHAPQQEIQIIRGIADDILSSEHITANNRKQLQEELDHLIQQVRLRKQPLDRYNLHPRVMEIAERLLADGHYRQALLDVYIELNDAVKLKSGQPNLDGTKLMQHVFSPNNPILLVSRCTGSEG